MKQHDIQRCASKLTIDFNEQGDVIRSTFQTANGKGFIKHKKDSNGSNEWTFELPNCK